jgi:hypothetical protein
MRSRYLPRGLLNAFFAGWLLVLALPSFAKQVSVPLPPPRPESIPAAQSSEAHSGCEQQLAAIATAAKQPVLTSPDGCGGSDLVQLSAVALPSGAELGLKPPAVLRCDMALAVAQWLREQATTVIQAKIGAVPISVEVAASYECRGRNRVKGAKLSEHGTGDAIDIRGLVLSNGHTLVLTSAAEPKELREGMREIACKAFTTVLGPGSDGYHESLVHLDLRQRKGNYKICQWNIGN